MATAPNFFTDTAVKDYIGNTFGNLTGDDLYKAVLKDAVDYGVSAEQLGRVLGFDATAVNSYAANQNASLLSEKQAIQNAVDFAYNNQYGRDASETEVKAANEFFTGGGTYDQKTQGSLTQGLGILNNSLEGYNYDSQSVVAGYRTTLGRNPTQTEYVSAMASIGYDPFDPKTLGKPGQLSATVAALESDPFAGRYANENPYGVYDPLTRTYKLDQSLPNVSTNVLGNSVQFTSPVTQRPMATSFENGKLVVKDGKDTLTGDQANSALALALNTGALTTAEYSEMLGSLKNAKSMDDIYAAFAKPQAVAALDPKYGFELGVGKTLEQAQQNSVVVQALVDQLAATNGGRLPANFSVANLAKEKGVPFQFGQSAYNQAYQTPTQTTKQMVVPNRNDVSTLVPQLVKSIYGKFGDLPTPLSGNYYSERGVEESYTPLGSGVTQGQAPNANAYQSIVAGLKSPKTMSDVINAINSGQEMTQPQTGGPMFRSGVTGYTPNLPSGFAFGTNPVEGSFTRYAPGSFDSYQDIINQQLGNVSNTTDMYNYSGSSYGNRGPVIGYDSGGKPIYGVVNANLDASSTGGQ